MDKKDIFLYTLHNLQKMVFLKNGNVSCFNLIVINFYKFYLYQMVVFRNQAGLPNKLG